MCFRLCRIATDRNTQGSLFIAARTVDFAASFSIRHCFKTMILEDIALSINVLRNVVKILLRKKGLTTRHLIYEGQLCSGFFTEYLIYEAGVVNAEVPESLEANTVVRKSEKSIHSYSIAFPR